MSSFGMVSIGEGVFAYGVDDHVAIIAHALVYAAYPSSRICVLLLEVVDTTRRICGRGNGLLSRQRVLY